MASEVKRYRTPESVKRPCPACKGGKVMRPSFVDSGKDIERTCSVCRGMEWLYLSKEEMAEMIAALEARLKALESAGALLLETHCCDSGESDYTAEWDGDGTVCGYCKPIRKALAPTPAQTH
jgi:hypothetical protein